LIDALKLAEAGWFPTESPHLALGRDVRLLVVFLDAIAAYERYGEQVQARVDTAMLVEREEGEGWRGSHAEQRLAEWGVVDQHGVYLLAGLTKRQKEVAELYYDRQMEPVEIAKLLKCDAHTVRVHLQAIRERLAKLAA
jgi:DNA-directed RNA polymerase specialized sigma24 family protein